MAGNAVRAYLTSPVVSITAHFNEDDTEGLRQFIDGD